MINARNEAREERKRQMLASGLLSDRFQDVSSIIVTLNYNRGSVSSLLRTLYFYPGSHAFFRVSCLGEGCDDGGHDLGYFIDRMVKGREKTAKGELRCENNDPSLNHSKVDYEVAITYS